MAATDSDDVIGTREELDELYPGAWACLLVPICPPTCDCNAPGKSPHKAGLGWNGAAIARYQDLSSRAPWLAQISEWVAAGGNVGLVMPPGVCALDVESAGAIRVARLAMPDSVLQRSGGGLHRGHVLARYDESRGLPGAVWVGDDPTVTRTGGSHQTVVQPSVHASGGHYEWIDPLPASLHELPSLPEAFYSKAPAQPAGASSPSTMPPRIGQIEWDRDFVTPGARVPLGLRRSFVLHVAGRLRSEGVSDPAEMESRVRAAFERHCEAPDQVADPGDITKIARDYCQRDGHPDERAQQQMGQIYPAVQIGVAPPTPIEPIGNLAIADSVPIARDTTDGPVDVPIPGPLVAFGAMEPGLDAAYVIDGWLEDGTVSVWYGESMTLKTSVVLDMAVAIGSGAPMWGGGRVRGGPVIYVASEGGQSLQNRILGAIQARGHEPSEVEGFLWPGRVNLLDLISVRHLIECVRETGCEPPRLVVFDTLRKSMEGDEDKSGDIAQVYHSCREVADAFGCAVIVVHHTGKDASRGARGSYALVADFDGTVDVSRTHGADGDPIDECIYQAHVTKQKDGPSGAKFTYRGDTSCLGLRSDGELRTVPVVVQLSGSEIPQRQDKTQLPAGVRDFVALLERVQPSTVPLPLHAISTGWEVENLREKLRDEDAGCQSGDADERTRALDRVRKSVQRSVAELVKRRIYKSSGGWIWPLESE